MVFAVLGLGAYLLGSLPFGLWIARRHGIDITKVGSGNIGATNVSRALGLRAAIVVFLLDMLKGLIPALAARLLLGSSLQAVAIGLIAVVGHSFSPFIGFKGGKGISTGLGAILGGDPVRAGIGLATFLIVMLPTRFVSLGSMTAGITIAVAAYVAKVEPGLQIIYACLAVFIVVRHRANIRRLLSGTEPHFGMSRSEPQSVAPNPDVGPRSESS
jgi:glycerol-3-phosphate acyltransferase PlsY